VDYDPDDEKWSPSSWLGSYASVLWSDYLEYWEVQNPPEDSELTPEQRAFFAQLVKLTEAILPCLHSLAVGPSVTSEVDRFFTALGINIDVNDDVAVKVTRAIAKHPIVRDGIKLDLAMQAADVLLSGAEARAPLLISLVSDRSLSDRAAAFLDRATKLYLWGFGPEAVVMCASVLEAAYEARFSLADMFALQITRNGREYDAVDYERAALAASVFTKEEKDLAAKVRQARNDTLHNAPNTALGPEDALRVTARLLDRLFPSQSHA